MRYLLAVLLILIAGTVSAGDTARSTPSTFLMPGEYHGGEAPYKLGSGWLALVPKSDGWYLVPAIATAKRINDPVLDDEKQATGVRITAHDDAIALLRLPALRPGKVSTPNMRFKGINRPISVDTPMKIDFNGFSYQIEVKKSQEESKVFLRKGEQTTLLRDIDAGEPDSDNSAALLWSGDLDGDGGLDLVVQFAGYNYGGTCVFLSGATRTSLVRQVACHRHIGC